MKIMLSIILSVVLYTTPFVINFGSENAGANWYVTNDGVMGGLSSGRLDIKEESIVFSGEVSLKNNGGFTKIDSPYKQYDLSKFKSITIRAKGQGQAAGFQFDLHQRFYLPSYKVMLEPADEWKEYTFDLADFRETQMGKWTGENISKENLSQIIRMGFIMSNKVEGSFAWEIDFIKFSY